MKKIVNLMRFMIGSEVIAVLHMEKDTIFDAEGFKCILATQYGICPDEIDVDFIQQEEKEPAGELFIAITGKLCFFNDFWNVEIVEGFSYVNWLDLSTEEGINTLSDYKFLGKADELVKFN